MNKEICKKCLFSKCLNDNPGEEIQFSCHTFKNYFTVNARSNMRIIIHCLKKVEFKDTPCGVMQDEKHIKWDEMHLSKADDCPYYTEHQMHDWEQRGKE